MGGLNDFHLSEKWIRLVNSCTGNWHYKIFAILSLNMYHTLFFFLRLSSVQKDCSSTMITESRISECIERSSWCFWGFFFQSTWLALLESWSWYPLSSEEYRDHWSTIQVPPRLYSFPLANLQFKYKKPSRNRQRFKIWMFKF